MSPQALILIFLIFLFICYFFFLLLRKPKSTTQIGFKNHPILGAIPAFLQNRHRFLDWTTEILSECPTNTAILSRPGKTKSFITANPANVEHMLKTNFDNYPKGTWFISLLEDLLGNGIFNAEGESWWVQRKTASYEFKTRSLRNYIMGTAVDELNNRFIPILQKAADLNQVIELQNLLERYAFDNICKVAFNVDPCCLAGDGTSESEFMKAFDEAANLINERFFSAFPELYKIKKLLKFNSEVKLQKSIATVHKFADDIIKSRMEEKWEKTDEDLLSRFMSKSEYSPVFLRDLVISFILAGRDTTSSALTWFFWILSLHPQVAQKILEELRTFRLSSGTDCREFYRFDDLRQLHYLHAAISESLRLFPPVPLDTRDCLKDDVMPDGTFVKQGWLISYSAYAMARVESVWGKDCHEFRPERWLEEEKSGGGKLVYRPESPFKFSVFNGGPRSCLGKEMAYAQMKMVAATIIEMFEVEVVASPEAKNPPEHRLSLTMRMKDGLRVRLRLRKR